MGSQGVSVESLENEYMINRDQYSDEERAMIETALAQESMILMWYFIRLNVCFLLSLVCCFPSLSF